MLQFTNLLLKGWLIAILCFSVPSADALFTSISLTGSLAGSTLEHQINLSDPAADGQDTITIRYTVPQTSWLAVGVNPTGSGMENGEVVIGKPDERTVLKYRMTARSGSAISELPNQTLINTSLQQSGGNTVLTFTKILDEADEYTITADESNQFIAAFGFSNAFGFHQGYAIQPIALDAGSVAAPTTPAPAPTTTAPMPTIPPATSAPFTAPTNPPGADILELTGDLDGSTLGYAFTFDDPATGGKDSITVTYTAPVTAWVGVGTSESGLMLGSEAVIGIPSTGQVKKYSLSSKSTDLSGIVMMPDEKQTLVNAAITQANGMTTLTYTKILVEDGEISINRVGENIFIAAHGISNTLGFHAVRGSFSLSGKVIERDNSLWVVHGWLAAIAWGLFCPLAILAGLFRKFIPGEGTWFQIHRILQTLVVVLTIASVAVAIAALNKDTPSDLSAGHFSPDFADGHRTIGLVVLIFAIVQVAGGVMRPHLPSKPEPTDDEEGNKGTTPEQAGEKSGARKAWEVLHRLVGVGLLALTWYQIQLGIFWYNEFFNSGDSASTLNIFYGVIGVLGALIVIGVAMKVFMG